MRAPYIRFFCFLFVFVCFFRVLTLFSLNYLFFSSYFDSIYSSFFKINTRSNFDLLEFIFDLNAWESKKIIIILSSQV